MATASRSEIEQFQAQFGGTYGQAKDAVEMIKSQLGSAAQIFNYLSTEGGSAAQFRPEIQYLIDSVEPYLANLGYNPSVVLAENPLYQKAQQFIAGQYVPTREDPYRGALPVGPAEITATDDATIGYGNRTVYPEGAPQPAVQPTTTTPPTGTVPTSAQPGLSIDWEALQDAVAGEESAGSGDYRAVGVATNGSKPYGRYQVMDFNIGPWTQKYFGQTLTPEQFLASREAQDAVFRGKIAEDVQRYGTIEDALSVWHSGRPLSQSQGAQDILGTRTRDYVQRIASNYQQTLDPARQTVLAQIGNTVSGQGNLPPELQGVLGALERQLDELAARGQMVNPNVQITPAQAAKFLDQAEAEIDPYYRTQLRLAREFFMRDMGFKQGQLSRFEEETQRNYEERFRNLADTSADRGFALSGIRQREEQELAGETQRSLDERRAQLAQEAGSAARTFAQRYGLGGVVPPQVRSLPQVSPGESTFALSEQRSPFYEISPNVYEGLVGSDEFARRGAVRTRASELEEAFRRNAAVSQQRTLTV